MNIFAIENEARANERSSKTDKIKNDTFSQKINKMNEASAEDCHRLDEQLSGPLSFQIFTNTIGEIAPMECSTKKANLIRARSIKRQPRTTFNRTLISLAIISFIISNQSFMVALIGSIRLFDGSNCAADVSASFNNAAAGGQSLIKLAAASPAPAPLRAASARSATSQRVPPMNGSMFGKRDLASQLVPSHQAPTSEPKRYNELITDVIEDFMAKNSEGKCGEDLALNGSSDNEIESSSSLSSIDHEY